jgi:hypothetical protein
VHATLDDLVLALYVTIDDLLRAHPEQLPPRPTVGFVPKVTDVELITLAVMAALGGYTSERRWLRHARQHLSGMFPSLPAQPGYNKRLRKLAPTMRWLIAMIGADCSIADDDVWVVDSTPVECARSRETVKRSDLAGWAEYGYCASHSRFFWGLRLHLVCTLHGLPVGWALTGAKADEREALGDILAACPSSRPGPAVRCSSPTRTTSDVSSRPTLQRWGSICCGPPARARPPARAHGSSNRCVRSSSRSTRPSRANSTSNTTKAAPLPVCAPASPSASSR